MGILIIMGDEDFVMLTFYLIASIVCGIIGWNKNLTFKDRNHSFIGYFMLSFLATPLVGLILAIALKNNRKVEKVEIQNSKDTDDNKNHSSNSEPIDTTEQIKKLSELKDQGVLTDEEFQSKKKDLLDKI